MYTERTLRDRAASGLLEGYALGASAKQLRLPEAALVSDKTASRSQAMRLDMPQSRTPLKTITQVCTALYLSCWKC